VVIISCIASGEQKNVEAQTVSYSNVNPVVVLDGTGKGTITCSNNESDNSSSSSSSSSSLIFTTKQVVLGQYAEMGLLIAISALGSFLPLIIPTYIIGLLGLVPKL
jgi:hypothetical protein